MVDEERVTRLLARIRTDVEALQADADAGGRLVDDRLRLDAVKYRFITAIEGCTRVAHHVAASEGWDAPDSNADSLRVLGDHGVIAERIAAELARAVGFRNVLVHQYVEVDDDVVVANLGRLDDLLAFVREVATWLEEHRHDRP